MHMFSVSKQNTFFLYGAATIGTIISDGLMAAGYKVKGFIDRRADEIISIHHLPVYAPNDTEIPRDAVIIVAVKNVWEHSRIANDLVAYGFCNIIYRPLSVLKGNEEDPWQIINQAYDCIEKKMFCKLEQMKIPQTLQRVEIILNQASILEERGEQIVSYIPVSMLFTDKKQGMPQLPVLGLLPHMEMVKYILGKPSLGYEKYLEYCMTAARRTADFKLTDAWKDNVIRNRLEVFLQMNHSYQLDQDYFIRSAPKVVWNSEFGCFHLCSGKHRAAFLAGKGDYYIPVCMSKEDYRLWEGTEHITDLQKAINESGLLYLTSPLEHPYTYDIYCVNEHFLFQLLYVVMEYFARREYIADTVSMFADKYVYLSLQDDGFMKRFFRRCGANVAGDVPASSMEKILDEMWTENKVTKEITENYGCQYGIIDCTEKSVQEKKCKVEFIIEQKTGKIGDKVQVLFESVYREIPVVVYLR